MGAFLINLFFSLVALFFVRIMIVLMRIHSNKKTIVAKRRMSCKVMSVIGSGGHTYEMLKLLPDLGNNYTPIIYILAESDKTSEAKIHKFEAEKLQQMAINRNDSEHSYVIERIPRSREVNQSWLSTLLTTFYAIIFSVPFVFRHQPDLILCNGPGTCVPICLAAFLDSVLSIKKIIVVYVESICRVETLSLSGKILYYFADHFIVQWPGLSEKYPRAKYMGHLVF